MRVVKGVLGIAHVSITVCRDGIGWSDYCQGTRSEGRVAGLVAVISWSYR